MASVVSGGEINLSILNKKVSVIKKGETIVFNRLNQGFPHASSKKLMGRTSFCAS